MHFYDFNIGDYAKKTQHLTNEEDLAYRRALDMYYDTEKPLLSGGLATLSRRLRVDETALKNVLEEFFPDGINKHADEKIAEYYAYLSKQSANGKRGGRPKHKGNKPTDNPPITQALPTDNPPPNQPLTTKPLTTNQELKAIAIGKPNCPHQEIINLYHEILPTSPVIRDWTPARAAALKARWNEGVDRQTLDYWRRLFEYIAGIPFLNGKVASNGRKPFFISLDWLVKAENFAKVREGRYEDQSA